MNQTFKQSLPLSVNEEVANSVTHAIGAAAMLILLPITAIYSYQAYDLKAAVGASIFIISLFLMFLSSTIYHSMSYGTNHKYILRIIDHSMIYIAIAGSYTPVALSLVEGLLGYVIIILQWGITFLGFYIRFLLKQLMKSSVLRFTLFMGWLSFLSCR
ncbi:hemolysin III family protein [Streptococcus equi subsp. zooepidemicus]|nr:hemolysin III family protein [Streptococcus equi subsp. zooepidemicus]